MKNTSRLNFYRAASYRNSKCLVFWKWAEIIFSFCFGQVFVSEILYAQVVCYLSIDLW